MNSMSKFSDREVLAFEAAVRLAAATAGEQPFEQIAEHFTSLHALTRAAIGLGAQTPSELKPAVPIERSITPEAIYCLECGSALTSLRRHLKSQHNMTPDDYRAKWDLQVDYPMVTAAYSERRSELAKTHGLGRR